MGGFTVTKSKRFISAEIEVENASHGTHVDTAIKDWCANVVEDGSLPPGGFEINTAPASGDEYISQINDICSALEEQNAVVGKSCGLHVHVDARDYSYYDIRRLVILYEHIEPAIFKLLTKSRQSNRYCYACGSVYLDAINQYRLPKASKKALIRCLYGTPDTKGHRHRKYENARYNALNLHSWLFRGTVEFRMFNGTVVANNIINWGILCANILDFAMKHTESGLEKLVRETSPRDLLLAVCPTTAVRDWVQRRYMKYL